MRTPTQITRNTFEQTLRSTLQAPRQHTPRTLPPGECQSAFAQRCFLCAAADFTYEEEALLKEDALKKFWKSQGYQIPLDPVVRSPKGREYRTVTKRKAFHTQRGEFRIGLIAPAGGESGHAPFPVLSCAIEPKEHEAIYATAGRLLEKPYAGPLAEGLSYIIIKGSYREFTIILNVREITPALVKSVNTMSRTLTHEHPAVIGVFLYEDRSNGRYYLGTKNPRARQDVRKVFGKATIYNRIMGKNFLYSPLSFSQVNQSIVEPMVTTAGRLLRLSRTTTLYDLYCGYGLFGLCLAGDARDVVGVEMSHDSIASATENTERQGTKNAKFVRSDITIDSLPAIMRAAPGAHAVILDPPRGGTSPGVIEYVGSRSPLRVVHIFCNIDLIAQDVKLWASAGYSLVRAIPFDMFPGTAAIEMMLLFEPAQSRSKGTFSTR